MQDPAAESNRSGRSSGSSPPGEPGRESALQRVGLFVAFGAPVLLVYRRCLSGPFLSDDVYYYLLNPAAVPDSLGRALALFDPRHPAHLFGANYAPLHLLAVAFERLLFGGWMPGYHTVNLLLHTLNAVLLVELLRTSRVPRVAAILGGALFALHPANVEAVAWISQLKGVASLTLGLAAMLCFQRSPGASLLSFGSSLLVKFASVAFLPMAAALAWSRRAPRRSWGWLAGWMLVMACISAAQLHVFSQGGSYEVEVYRDAFEQLRSIVAIGGRYLWMAASGLGLSTFHDPEPARSLLDPWWLLGLALGGAIAARTVATLRRRQEEGAWWLLALAAFVPVSQIVPFRFPIADRYLYFMLPGLIGATTLAGVAAWRRLFAGVGPRPGIARAAGLAGGGAALLLCAWFGARATTRIPLWLDDLANLEDSARNYPEGTHGLYFRAVEAARHGDAKWAVSVLRELEERKRFSLTKDYARDPRFAYIRNTPEFSEFVRELARYRIDLVARRGPRPGEEAVLALKYADLGDYDTAIGLIEKSLREGDHRAAQLLQVLDELRSLRLEQQRAERSTAPDGGGAARDPAPPR